MSLIDELHKLMKEKKYTFAYTAKAMNISSNNEKIVTGSYYWLASAVSGLSRVYSNRRNL